MARARDHIPLKIQLAAALVQLGEIPFEHARLMNPDQIISLFHRDHGIFHAWGGPDEHWNLRFRLIAAHRVKTKADVSIIAKVKRLTKKEEAFRVRVLAKDTGDLIVTKPKRKIPSRPFDKSKRPMRSSNSFRRSV